MEITTLQTGTLQNIIRQNALIYFGKTPTDWPTDSIEVPTYTDVLLNYDLTYGHRGYWRSSDN